MSRIISRRQLRKEQCLAAVDHTKGGKPVARVDPGDREFTGLIGSLREKIEIRGDAMRTGVRWNADAKS